MEVSRREKTIFVPLIPVVLLILAAGAGILAQVRAPRETVAGPVDRTTLANGLEGLFAPVPAGRSAALVVLYSIGEDHDPARASGTAHLIEHLLVTAAAGLHPGRSADDFARRYPLGWNAQTGDKYTVIATVFDPADLERELKEAAARMAGLEPSQADVEREKARIMVELENMYEAVPTLALMNAARESLRPAPAGGRKGGRPEDISKLSRTALLDRIRRYYKPKNAILVAAGSFQPDRVRRMVDRYFSDIPGGEEAPGPAEPGPPQSSMPRTLRLGRIRVPPSPAVCLAFRAPASGSADFAPFLVLAGRLMAGSAGYRAGTISVNYAVFDDPEIFRLTMTLEEGANPSGALRRLADFVRTAAAGPLRRSDLETVRNAFGFMLGIAPWPREALANNIYGYAFSLGRAVQLEIVPEALAGELDGLSGEALRDAAGRIFREGNSAAVLMDGR
jgi:zinc protease